MTRAAWTAMHSLLETPERNTPEAIRAAHGPYALSLHDIRDGLERLRRLDYAAEANGRWELSEWCRGALQATPGTDAGIAPMMQPLHELLRRLGRAAGDRVTQPRP